MQIKKVTFLALLVIIFAAGTISGNLVDDNPPAVCPPSVCSPPPAPSR